MSNLEEKQKLKIVEIIFTPTPDDGRLRRVFELLLSPLANPESSESLKSDNGGKTDE